MAKPKLGQTPGKVRQLYGVARFYPKPTLGKLIIRKAGVNRRSMNVIRINEKLHNLKGTGNTPAEVCRAKYLKEHPGYDGAVPIDYMRDCMSAEMERVVGGARRVVKRARVATV